MWPFRSKSRSSVVLIEISSSGVAGAYAHFKEKELPTIYYTVRKAIEPREGEALKDAMLRTLDAVGTELIESEAPTLRRMTGSGRRR